MATIRKRKGKWQVQVRHLGHNQISKTFLRRQEAEQWARELEVSFAQGNFVSRSFDYPIFSKIIERYTKLHIMFILVKKLDSIKEDEDSMFAQYFMHQIFLD